MPVIEASRDYEVDPRSIWDLIVDFGNIERWWPATAPVKIERVELEGTGVGMIRHIYNEGMAAPVSERLDEFDNDSMTWRLSIVGDRPFGLLQYQARGCLVALPGGGCRLFYHGEFEAAPGAEGQAHDFLAGVYDLMLDGFAQAARRP